MRQLSVWALILATSVIPSSSALSQDRKSGAGLTVFTDRNFRGESATLRQDTPDFHAIGMDDPVRSLKVGGGEFWEVCQHANYQGRCVVVSGSEGDLGRTGLTGLISSARRIPRGRGATQSAVPALPALELFSGTGFTGDRRAFTGPESDLRRVGFNNIAQSLRTQPGQQWQVCADINFANCLVVNTDWRDLTLLGMSRTISSVRPWTPR